MSSESEAGIPQKIELIRSNDGLSIAAFAEKINVAVSTMKNVCSRGTTPGLDVIQKLVNAYPQYTYWLYGISLQINSVPQIQPGDRERDEWRIIQNLSMTDLELNKCCIKPEFFEKIMMVQANDEINTLMCIVILKKIDASDEKICIKIGAEDFHFFDKSGQNKLDRLRAWFNTVERTDLVKTAELYYSTTKILENLYKTKILLGDDLKESENFNLSLKSSSVFSNWKNGREMDYSKNVNF
ncbi:MAG: XRE family transcriptional regulator [Gammaproteobacteria bacterium]|nr:MAG: XRE family transcriptional regulator [Gammaproteobacteria bacterium]